MEAKYVYTTKGFDIEPMISSHSRIIDDVVGCSITMEEGVERIKELIESELGLGKPDVVLTPVGKSHYTTLVKAMFGETTVYLSLMYRKIKKD